MRKSPSRRMPRLGLPPPRPAFIRAPWPPHGPALATRPPAMSATANSGSQISASRSSTPTGISGRVASRIALRRPARQTAQSSPIGDLNPPPVRLDLFLGARRRMRTMIERDRIVSGNQPSPASATAE